MFLTQIVNGQMSELALCEECAKARGLFDPQSLTFAEKFFPEEFKKQVDRIVRELTGGDEQKHTSAAEGCDMITACPVCHFSLEDYRRTNRLGCPECYTFLAGEINATRCEQDDADETAGDGEPAATAVARPDSMQEPAPRPRKRSVKALEAELQRAVEREDYERAAELRDEIKAINNSSKA